MTDREKAIVMARTGICMLAGDKMGVFYQYLSELYGRPVYTHEIPLLDIKERASLDFLKLCEEEQPDVPGTNVGNCEYCNEDFDGYVKPIEKNCHAFVYHSPIDGWVLSLKYGAWRKDVPIRFCPICGRELKHG